MKIKSIAVVLVLFCFQNIFAEKKSIVVDDGYILFDNEDYETAIGENWVTDKLNYLSTEFEDYMLSEGWKPDYNPLKSLTKPAPHRLNGFTQGSVTYLAAKRSLVYGTVYSVKETENEAKVWIFCKTNINKDKSGEVYVWGVYLVFYK